MSPPDEFHLALIDEVMKKTGLCWVRWRGEARDHPVWHVWRDGAAYVVSGRDEQPLPGADTPSIVEQGATVTTRTKDSRARLIGWEATAQALEPGSTAWEEAVELLRAERLNLTDADHVRERWIRGCTVLRFVPTGQVAEAPGSQPDDSLAAEPLPTSAVTRGRLPRVLHRRQQRSPRLR